MTGGVQGPLGPGGRGAQWGGSDGKGSAVRPFGMRWGRCTCGSLLGVVAGVVEADCWPWGGQEVGGAGIQAGSNGW